MFVLHREDIQAYYPNKFIQRGNTDRYYILNTLFNLSGIKFTWKVIKGLKETNTPFPLVKNPT